jgi:hypothetical protein
MTLNHEDHPALAADMHISTQGTPVEAGPGPLSLAFGRLFKRLDPRTAGYGPGLIRMAGYYCAAWVLFALTYRLLPLPDAHISPVAFFAIGALTGAVLSLKIKDTAAREVYGRLHLAGLVAALFCLITSWALPYFFKVTAPALLGYGVGSAGVVILLAITTPPKPRQGKT